jgi:hypothetical protein
LSRRFETWTNIGRYQAFSAGRHEAWVRPVLATIRKIIERMVRCVCKSAPNSDHPFAAHACPKVGFWWGSSFCAAGLTPDSSSHGAQLHHLYTAPAASAQVRKNTRCALVLTCPVSLDRSRSRAARTHRTKSEHSPVILDNWRHEASHSICR